MATDKPTADSGKAGAPPSGLKAARFAPSKTPSPIPAAPSRATASSTGALLDPQNLTPRATRSRPATTKAPAKAAGKSSSKAAPTSTGAFTTESFLAALRAQESGGNYAARSGSSSASGAYQYLDSTWNNFGGYARAADAPQAVQDQRAKQDVEASFKRYGGDWRKVAAAHFAGAGWVAKHPDPAQWGVNPVPGSKNPTVSGYVNSLFAKAGTTAATGGASAGPTDVSAGTSVGDAQADPKVSIATYGYIAQLAKREPDLAKLMAKYANEDLSSSATQQRLEAEIQGTNWWKNNTDAYRKAEIKKAQNPGDFAADIEAQKTAVKQAADAYLIPISDHTIQHWSTMLAEGKITPDEYTNYLKEQAKSLFPGLGAAIDRGVTVKAYTDPYAQVASQTLEMPPESIDFMRDPKFTKALFQKDPKTGENSAMSLADWGTYLRTLPEYAKTKGANEQAAQFGNSLLSTFGKVAQ